LASQKNTLDGSFFKLNLGSNYIPGFQRYKESGFLNMPLMLCTFFLVKLIKDCGEKDKKKMATSAEKRFF